MCVMIIAGVSFPSGAGDLGEVARRHGYDPIFLDHPHNAVLLDAGPFPVRYEVHFPEDLASRSGVLLPLLESWVSEGRNLAAGAGLRFDRHAASVSRSKLALTESLAAAGLDFVPRFPVGTVEQAIHAASACGFPAVLRVDTGYSGHGVLIASTEDELRACWAYQAEERDGAEYIKMRSVMNETGNRLLIEPWLPGDEWSIGHFLSRGGQVRTVSAVDVEAVSGPKTFEIKLLLRPPETTLPGKLSGLYTWHHAVYEKVPEYRLHRQSGWDLPDPGLS